MGFRHLDRDAARVAKRMRMLRALFETTAPFSGNEAFPGEQRGWASPVLRYLQALGFLTEQRYGRVLRYLPIPQAGTPNDEILQACALASKKARLVNPSTSTGVSPPTIVEDRNVAAQESEPGGLDEVLHVMRNVVPDLITATNVLTEAVRAIEAKMEALYEAWYSPPLSGTEAPEPVATNASTEVPDAKAP